MEKVLSFFVSPEFMPHGMCYLWRPQILWLHVVSDAVIVLAYLSIPIALITFLRRRKDLRFPWIFRLFAAFIFLCAMTHLMGAIVVWEPAYGLQGMVKLLTAAVSLATATLLWPLIPRAVALPSPAQLQAANAELEREVAQRRVAEQELIAARLLLEERVAARTAELERANADLSREILERQQAEMVVRDREHRLQAIADALPMLITEVDHEHRYRYNNAAYRSWLDRDPRDIEGCHMRDVIGSENYMAVLPRLKRCLRGEPLNFSCDLKLASGQVIETERIYIPNVDDCGTVVGAYLVAIDVSRVRELERRFELVVEAAPNAFIIVDDGGSIKMVNEQAERMFGYPREELTGQSIQKLVPARKRNKHEQFVRSYLAKPESRSMGAGRELHGLRKDGSRFPVEIGLTPVQTPEGHQVISTIIDITERTEHLHRLQGQARDLKKLNDQLRKSNEELDDFAYIASHDLKEPLRGIRSYIDYLMEEHLDALNEEARDKMRTVEKLSERLSSLIDSLLQTSRVGRTDLRYAPNALDKIVDEVLESLKISIEEKGATVRRLDELPALRCDHALVSEVFRNLITNALKYNDKQDPVIELGWRTGANGSTGEKVLFVRDNGIGIREKHFQTVFRLFKRLHGRDKFGGGTGSGLTIVKKIVERHGGRVWVESRYAEGSTFCFTLGRR